jgi:clathrin heavy chain
MTYSLRTLYVREKQCEREKSVQVLEGRIDHTRVVALVRRGGHLGLVKDYLLSVQKNNLVAVNEAINELHISEDDYEGVDASVQGYDNFDQLKLAEELEVCLPPCPHFLVFCLFL